MKRPVRLSATFCRQVNEPGRYGDGRGSFGLSLLVKETSTGRWAKSWSQRLRIAGRPVSIGLGGYPLVSLQEARDMALDNARTVRRGGDPRADRAASKAPLFEVAAERVIEMHAAGWKDGGKSAAQWRASLRDYAMPRLGKLQVDAITTADVLAVVEPIWNTRRETARRVKQRISRIMQWAVAEGHRSDDPAGPALGGAALPKNGHHRRHQTALPHADVADAIRSVRESGAYFTTKLALEFLTLTATRSGEVRGATWSEVDLDAATWTVPAERMKSKREHAVPLSGRALAVLAEAAKYRDTSGLVFPSATGRVLSDNTLSKLLRELQIPAVIHGMRSSFRDWCADAGQPREVAEHALAHVVRGVEGAYQRSTMFERRRALMDAWGAYVTG